jgi:hypothetical protein
MRDDFFTLMRRNERWDEQYPVQLQPLPDLLGRGKVAEVDRIECSAEDAESLRQLTSGFDFGMRIADCGLWNI